MFPSSSLANKGPNGPPYYPLPIWGEKVQDDTPSKRQKDLSRSVNTLYPVPSNRASVIPFASRAVHQPDETRGAEFFAEKDREEGVALIKKQLSQKIFSMMVIFIKTGNENWSWGTENEAKKELRKTLHKIYNTAFIQQFSYGVQAIEIELLRKGGLEKADIFLDLVKTSPLYQNGICIALIRHQNGLLDPPEYQGEIRTKLENLASVAQPIYLASVAQPISCPTNLALRTTCLYPIVNQSYYFEPVARPSPLIISRSVEALTPRVITRRDLNDPQFQSKSLAAINWSAILKRNPQLIPFRPPASIPIDKNQLIEQYIGRMALPNERILSLESLKRHNRQDELFIFTFENDRLKETYRLPPEESDPLIPSYDNLEEAVEFKWNNLLKKPSLENQHPKERTLYAARPIRHVKKPDEYFNECGEDFKRFCVLMLESTDGPCVTPDSPAFTKEFLPDGSYSYTNLLPFLITFESRRYLEQKKEETLVFHDALKKIDIRADFQYDHDFDHDNVIQQFFKDPAIFTQQFAGYPLEYGMEIYHYPKNCNVEALNNDLQHAINTACLGRVNISQMRDLLKKEFQLLPLGTEFFRSRPWLKSHKASKKYLKTNTAVQLELKTKSPENTQGKNIETAKATREYLLKRCLYLHLLKKNVLVVVYTPDLQTIAYLGLNS